MPGCVHSRVYPTIVKLVLSTKPDKSYNDLKHSYQIVLLVNNPMYKDDVFVHHFKHYDEINKVSLGGRSHIIVIELAKLEKIAQKPVAEITALERWAVFFRYTPDKEKREQSHRNSPKPFRN